MLSKILSISQNDAFKKYQPSNWITDLASLSFFLLLFYTVWLGSYPLFTPDEGRYSEAAREMLTTKDFITPHVNGIIFLDKPILHYWLQAIALYIFGIKEWSTRLFPMLFGLFGCLTTYICGRFLFNRRSALISTVILATSPLYFAGAHYANLDLEVAVLISCTLLFFITGIEGPDQYRKPFILASYVFAALAFLAKGMIGIAFPLFIIGSWIILLRRGDVFKKIHFLFGFLIFMGIALPWYILVQKANPLFLHYFFVTQQVVRFLSIGDFNNSTPFWFYIPILLVGFFPWSAFLANMIFYHVRNVWIAPSKHQTVLFLLLWFIIIFIFFSIPRSKIITYILPVFPALALLVRVYLSHIWGNVNKKEIYTIVMSFLIVGISLSVFAILLTHYRIIDLSPKFTPYLYVIALVTISSTIFTLLLIRNLNLLLLFILCISTSICLLLTMTVGAAHLNQDSAKPLVENLKNILNPEDEVINYFKFYQDIPFYLGKPVTIVADWDSPEIPYRDNWVRELWHGTSFGNANHWLITEDKFWDVWSSNKRVFVFLSVNYFFQFKLHAKSYYVLGKYNDIILLSNKITRLAKKGNLNEINLSYFPLKAREESLV